MICDWRWSPLVLVAVVAWVACDNSKTTTIDDTGSVCLIPTADGITVSVLVEDACLAGACRRLDKAGCKAVVADGDISISSHVEVVSDPDISLCPASCDPARLSCVLAPVQQGEHAVSHGGETTVLTFPLDEPTLVFGNIAACPDSDI